jgi:hypothetical protein
MAAKVRRATDDGVADMIYALEIALGVIVSLFFCLCVAIVGAEFMHWADDAIWRWRNPLMTE